MGNIEKRHSNSKYCFMLCSCAQNKKKSKVKSAQIKKTLYFYSLCFIMDFVSLVSILIREQLFLFALEFFLCSIAQLHSGLHTGVHTWMGTSAKRNKLDRVAYIEYTEFDRFDLFGEIFFCFLGTSMDNFMRKSKCSTEEIK